MPMNLSTVNVTQVLTLLFGAQGSNAVLTELINTSTTVTIWVGYSQQLQVGIAGIPLAPGASIAFDGTVAVYGICPAGQSAQMAIVPGGSSYSPGTMISALFSSSGVTTVPAMSTITPLALVDVSGFNSYDLSCAITDALQGTAGHALNAVITVAFFDDLLSGIPIYQEIWNPWVVTTTGSATEGIIGAGPMHGHYMTLSINNPSGFAISVKYLNVFGSPRNLQLSDWRQNYGNHVADAVYHELPNIGTGYENSLGDTNGFDTLSAGLNYILPLSLYAGPVAWYWQSGANITFNGAAIIDIGTANVLSGGITNGQGTLVTLNVATGTFANGTAILPRSACAIIVRVSGTGGQFALKCVAQQGP